VIQEIEELCVLGNEMIRENFESSSPYMVYLDRPGSDDRSQEPTGKKVRSMYGSELPRVTDLNNSVHLDLVTVSVPRPPDCQINRVLNLSFLN
jgi:hypothetical protein